MRIGIIGYGNLGKAFVKGLVLTGFSQRDIVINARTERTRDSVRNEFKDIYVTASKEELVNGTDVVILITEPINAKEVLNEIKDYYIDGKILISFMAGITMAEIRNVLGDKQNVVKLDENSLNHITVTAASGLAFAASLMDSYQKAGNTLFNNEEISKEITLRVFENAIDMVKKEGCSFEDIVRRITTKGGTTEAGMKHLNPGQITENLENCMKKSYEKAGNIIS